MRESPAETASIRYRAQGGVIGYMSDCSNGWCAFETGGKRGFVLQKYLWGGTK
jgi:SH3-like domain-containing protein